MRAALLACFTALAHLSVWLAVPLAALTTLIVAVPGHGGHLPTAHSLSCGRHLGRGGHPDADRRKAAGLRRRLGHQRATPVIKQFGARLGDRIDIFYAMSLGLALIAFVATWALLRSRIGLGLTAMRDNEEAAGSAGVDLVKTRVICFLWTAPLLGLAGVMTALEKLRVAPTASFNITDWTIDIIFIVVIGGIGSLEGPIIGAIIFLLTPVARRLRRLVPHPPRRDLDRVSSCSSPKGLWGFCRRLGRSRHFAGRPCGGYRRPRVRWKRKQAFRLSHPAHAGVRKRPA